MSEDAIKARDLDNLVPKLPSVDDIDDINEILGRYDGQILLIREAWDEMKNLIGLGDNNERN